jgi:hypothetical protein
MFKKKMFVSIKLILKYKKNVQIEEFARCDMFVTCCFLASSLRF